MDIVKQRRKRLMAWILALVLCVGMWQGSVYATEGEGDGNKTVSGSDVIVEDTTVPEPEQAQPLNYGVAMVALEEEGGVPVGETTIIYNVNLSLVDTNGGGIKYPEGDIGPCLYYSFGNTLGSGDELFPWQVGGSGLVAYSDNAVITVDKYVNNDHEHNILGWKKSSDEGVSIQGNTLDLNSFFSEEQKEGDMVKGEAYAVLGRSVRLFLWGEGTSGEVLSESLADSGKWSVILPTPEADMLNSEDGRFFVGWKENGEGTLLKAGDNYSRSYEQFEEEIYLNLRHDYSETVYEGGKYSLLPDKDYYLGAGMWNVTGDDYSYSGNDTDMGNMFYINSESNVELEFKLQGAN